MLAAIKRKIEKKVNELCNKCNYNGWIHNRRAEVGSLCH